MEDELEQIRRKRQETLQREEQAVGIDEGAMAQEDEYQARRQMVLRKILTPEARMRLSNIRMTRPDVVQNIEDQLIALASAGRIGVVDDMMLKQILRKVMPKKREIKIERR
ncbi:MAG: DNA-binding protein [Thermoplasmata archaeon]|nr:DNA-binding protein [Thermoplasmata archaeon]